MYCAHVHLMMHTPSCAELASTTATLYSQQVHRITAMPSLLTLQECLNCRVKIRVLSVQRPTEHCTLLCQAYRLVIPAGAKQRGAAKLACD